VITAIVSSYIFVPFFPFYQVMDNATPTDMTPVIRGLSSVRNRQTVLQMVLEGTANENTDISLLECITRQRCIAPSSSMPSQHAPSVTTTCTTTGDQHNSEPFTLNSSIRDTASHQTQDMSHYYGHSYDANYHQHHICMCYCDQPLAPTDCSLCDATED
jgi:hypothetical protein